jgi:hypothetical protein
MIPLEQYAKLRNKFGLQYLGRSDEYLLQLKAIRHSLEEALDVEFTIIHRDAAGQYLAGEERLMPASRFNKLDFAHIVEIRFDAKSRAHPLESLLEECNLKQLKVKTGDSPRTTRCVILSNGQFPTKSLTDSQVSHLEKLAKRLGYHPELNTDVENTGLVMGVEGTEFYKAALAGVETKLVPTGVGTRLYKMMFPGGEILKV